MKNSPKKFVDDGSRCCCCQLGRNNYPDESRAAGCGNDPRISDFHVGSYDFQILNQKALIRKGGLLLGYGELRLFPREVAYSPHEFFLGLF
jgi:hypothetical protein